MEKNVKLTENSRFEKISETQIKQADLDLIKGGEGVGEVVTVSGECNMSGVSCRNLEGAFDQLEYWFFG